MARSDRLDFTKTLTDTENNSCYWHVQAQGQRGRGRQHQRDRGTERQRDTSACVMTYPVKLLLELFIRIIYTELLKTVPIKGLKPAPRQRLVSSHWWFQLHTADILFHPVPPSQHHSPIYIQHPNEGSGLSPLGAQGRVESLDSPCEQLAVDVFGQCVSGFCSLLPGSGFDQHLSPHSQPAMAQPVGHLRPFDSEQLGEDSQSAVVCLRKDKESCIIDPMWCTDWGNRKKFDLLQYNSYQNFSHWLGCWHFPGGGQLTGPWRALSAGEAAHLQFLINAQAVLFHLHKQEHDSITWKKSEQTHFQMSEKASLCLC